MQNAASIVRLFLITFAGLLLLGACEIAITVPSGGAINIQVDSSAMQSSSSRAISRTTAPVLMEIYKYEFVATSNLGEKLPLASSADGAFHLDKVPPGFWTVTMAGYNAQNQVVAGGTVRVQVEAGKILDVTVFIAPIGTSTGNLKWNISWPATQKVDTLRLLLGTVETAVLSPTGSSAAFSSALVPGSYTAFLVFERDGKTIQKLTRAVQIFQGMDSAEDFAMTATDFNHLLNLGPWPSTIATWSPLENGGTALVQNNGFVYFVGGLTKIGESGGSAIWGFVDTVTYCRIDSTGKIGSIIATTSLPVPLAYTKLAVSGNYLYVAGGSTSTGSSIGNFFNKVLVAPINSDGSLGNFVDAGNDLPVTIRAGTMEKGRLIAWTYDNPLSGKQSYLIYVGSTKITSAPINTLNGSIGPWADSPALIKGNVFDSFYHKIGTKTFLYVMYSTTTGGFFDWGELQSTGIVKNWQVTPVSINPGLAGAYSNLIAAQGTTETYAFNLSIYSGITSINKIKYLDAFGTPTLDTSSGFSYIRPGMPSDMDGSAVPFIAYGKIMWFQTARQFPRAFCVPIKADGSLDTLSMADGVPSTTNMYNMTVTDGTSFYHFGDVVTGSIQRVYQSMIAIDGSPVEWKEQANSLSTVANSPYMASCLHNGKVYVFGANAQFSSISASDGSLGTWSTLATFPVGVSKRSVIVGLGTNLYLGEGAKLSWVPLDANGNTGADWDSQTTFAAGTTIVPFVWGSELYAVFAIATGGSYTTAAIIQEPHVYKIPREANGKPKAYAEWIDLGGGFGRLPDFPGVNFTIFRAAVGPAGVYFILEPASFGYYTYNYIAGVQLKSDGTMGECGIVSRIANYRTQASMMTAKGKLIIAGGQYKPAYQGDTGRFDLLTAALDPYAVNVVY